MGYKLGTTDAITGGAYHSFYVVDFTRPTGTRDPGARGVGVNDLIVSDPGPGVFVGTTVVCITGPSYPPWDRITGWVKCTLPVVSIPLFTVTHTFGAIVTSSRWVSPLLRWGVGGTVHGVVPTRVTVTIGIGIFMFYHEFYPWLYLFFVVGRPIGCGVLFGLSMVFYASWWVFSVSIPVGSPFSWEVLPFVVIDLAFSFRPLWAVFLVVLFVNYVFNQYESVAIGSTFLPISVVSRLWDPVRYTPPAITTLEDSTTSRTTTSLIFDFYIATTGCVSLGVSETLLLLKPSIPVTILVPTFYVFSDNTVPSTDLLFRPTLVATRVPYFLWVSESFSLVRAL